MSKNDHTKDPDYPYASKSEIEIATKYYEKIVIKLPEPKGGFSKKAVVLSIIKQIRKVGIRNFFRISIPIVFICPVSMLELMSLYYTPTKDLYTIRQCKHPEERFLRCLKWAMKNIPRMISRNGITHTKPYNPIIGEIFVWKWKHEDGSSTVCLGEQVSHHPPISAYYMSNRKNNFSMRTTIYPVSKLYPNSFSVEMLGEIVFRINDLDEEFELSFPPVVTYGILFGKQFSEHNGEYVVKCKKHDYKCTINFKEKEENKISGKIKKGGETIYKISGVADEKILIKNAKTKKVMLFCDNSSKDFFEIKQVVKKIGDQEWNESRRNWHMVTKHLKDGNDQLASDYKNAIENKQREKRKIRNENDIEWKPKYFSLLKEKSIHTVEKNGEVDPSKNGDIKVPLFKLNLENKTAYKEGEKDEFESSSLFQGDW